MKWFWRTVKEANSPNSCLNWDSSVVDRLIGRLQGAHGERVAGLGIIHGEDTIDNFLHCLLGEVNESQGGSNRLVESGNEGLIQVVSQDFPSQMTV